MTTTYTRNLRLRIDSNMTTDAKFNLETLDGVYSSFVTTMAGTKVFSSVNGFTFLPAGQSAGGSVTFGGYANPVLAFRIYGPLLASSLGVQPATGSYSFTFLPNPSQTQNISLTLPATAGSARQVLMLDPTDPTKLIFGDVETDPVTDEQIVAAQLGELFLNPTSVMVGDSIETAFGKVQGQFDNLAPLVAMTPQSLVKTGDDGFLVEFVEVSPAELINLRDSAGSYTHSFGVADWQDLTATLWTLTIPVATHNLGASVYVANISESNQSVLLDSVSVSEVGQVSLSVPKEPDLRFIGKAVLCRRKA